ncbi:copper chaperone NosL [uncultured Gammaproteobacteria bacterium]
MSLRLCRLSALVLALALVVALTACLEPSAPPPPPREPGPDAVGQFCHMLLSEHQGPKGQVFQGDDQTPLWFSTVHDTLVYLFTIGVTQNVRAVYVNDMGRASWAKPEPGTWISAKTAWYVIGSQRPAAMGGGEMVPFSDPVAAQTYTKTYGGQVVPFDRLPRDLDQNPAGPPPSFAPAQEPVHDQVQH